MDKDNEIVKLREHYQYLEEYLQQEISKQDSSNNIEILNEMIVKNPMRFQIYKLLWVCPLLNLIYR